MVGADLRWEMIYSQSCKSGSRKLTDARRKLLSELFSLNVYYALLKKKLRSENCVAVRNSVRSPRRACITRHESNFFLLFYHIDTGIRVMWFYVGVIGL